MYDLAQRVAALDAQDGGDVGSDVNQFISVLAEVVSFGTGDVSEMPKWRPDDADRVLAGCRLLARLGSAVPEIVSGPLDRSAQYWISAEKPSHLPPNVPALAAEHFRPVAPQTRSTKPFTFGLHTSTGFMATQGMWRAYLDLYEGSAVPLPVWHVWALTARQDAAVLEITTATEWAAFIDRFPVEACGLLYPDWQAVATQFDAVHMTIRAIAAAQGLCFYVPNGITAPAYWDVETTFWLRWCLETYELVEIAPFSSSP